MKNFLNKKIGNQICGIMPIWLYLLYLNDFVNQTKNKIKMGFLNKILGFRGFHKRDEIIEKIKSSELGNSDSLQNVNYLIIFETTSQKTWLICSKQNLFCVLDEIDSDTLIVRWKMTKHELLDNSNNLKIKLNIDFDYKEKVGKVDFGSNHKSWKITKKFFDNSNTFRRKFESLIEIMKNYHSY